MAHNRKQYTSFVSESWEDDLLFGLYLSFWLVIVRTVNKLNIPVSFLGLQYTYNVGFGFPILGDSILETQ